MALGEKIRRLRVERGLSQRQLCGDQITRNMLSQIENGSARPSMDTLRFLARQLQLPVSYLLEEEGAVSVNQGLMADARQAFSREEWERVRSLLREFQEPDEIFSWEKDLLLAKADLALARQAFAQGKEIYAQGLLEEVMAVRSPYCGRELEFYARLLLIQAGKEEDLDFPELPALLQAHARAALKEERPDAARAYLDALSALGAEEPWLQGQAYFAAGEYRMAVECFHKVEEQMGKPAYEKLEQCYQALEDYKMAYFYACKQK